MPVANGSVERMGLMAHDTATRRPYGR